MTPRSRLPFVVLSALLMAGTASSVARAQEGLAGAVQASFVASPDGDFGGALGADLWFAADVFRIGGFFGVAAVPSAEDIRNRVFMPLGVSAAIELLGDVVGVSLRARAGLWGGATQEVKLTAGGFVGGAAYLLIHLGGGVALSAGLEVWAVLGDGESALFAPGLGLTWAPPSGEP